MKKKVILKFIGTVVVIGGAIITVAKDYIDEKKMEERIDEKIEERFNELKESN